MNIIFWRNLKIGTFLLLLSGAAACGQKGDLYLPPEVNQNEPANTLHV